MQNTLPFRQEWVWITPEIASRMLEKNTHNVPLIQSKVDRYATDMKAGRWKTTHEAIGLADDGTIMDGQHRLWAVVLAEATIMFLVVYGVSKEAQLVINSNPPRPKAASLNLKNPGFSLTSVHAAIAKAMAQGLGSRSGSAWTISQCDEFICKHREAIDFATTICCSHRGITAVVRAVIGRAWYTQNRELLKAFVEVMRTETSPRGLADSSAALLRKWATKEKVLSGGSVRTELYGKTENALRFFLVGQPITKLYAATEELFPIPGDPGYERAALAG